MTDVEMLEQIKIRLGVTGNYHDDLLTGYIEDVKHFLEGAGIPETTLNSKTSVGVIARGVADVWNFGSGDGTWSNMFYNMSIQLALRGE